MEETFSTWSISRSYKQTERNPSAWGYNWATLFLGDIDIGPGHLGWESLKFQIVIFGHESCGTQNRERVPW
jgi:hypothetical protein